MSEDISDESFLATVEGEIAFFRAMMRCRPIGMHRHFHVLNIRNGILKDTGHPVSIESIWTKLHDLYDMDALEAIDTENANFEARQRAALSENIGYSLEEYTIPYDSRVEEIIAERRMRNTPSPVSPSPSPQPVVSAPPKRGRPRKRGKSKLDLAGLVGGDSDSSALTQESGDEVIGSPVPRDSATVTEGGTEYGGDEDTEMRDASPESTAPRKKAPTGRRPGRPRGGGGGRGKRKAKK